MCTIHWILLFWWNISNNTTLILNYFTSQGDTIHLTCTSNMSQPAAKLEWTVNNQPVKVGHLQTCEHCEPCLTMLGMEITILLAERAQSAQSMYKNHILMSVKRVVSTCIWNCLVLIDCYKVIMWRHWKALSKKELSKYCTHHSKIVTQHRLHVWSPPAELFWSRCWLLYNDANIMARPMELLLLSAERKVWLNWVHGFY